jgi:hypothetical protein
MADIEPGGIFSIFVVLMIFITKIIQLMKRGNQQAPPAHPPPAQPVGRAKSAEDELRSFLEQLSGGRPAQPPAAPAQNKPAQRAVAFDAPVQGAVAAPAPAPPRPPPVPQAQTRVRRMTQPGKPPPPIPKNSARATAAAALAAAPVPRSGSGVTRSNGRSAGRGMLRLLRDRESVQQAVLLREILGEPIALRRPNMSAQPTGSPRKSPKRLPPEDDSLLLHLGNRPR